ncbi:hypothetical protein F5H01DRAFT_355201 [Linnemannia elongata]|nr:hypothetical protein F5H01DRAFT_355201 [Linnemannia elongata]
MTGTGLVDCISLSPSVFVALALFVCVCRRWISIPHTHTKEGENPDQRPPFLSNVYLHFTFPLSPCASIWCSLSPKPLSSQFILLLCPFTRSHAPDHPHVYPTS